jgi:adenosylmethionine-8-amino-7-oxononanoate aminotransferase
MKFNEIIEKDRRFLLHPYDSSVNPLDVLAVKGGDKEFLYLADGTKLIDGMSSWWSVIHGYNNGYINDALKNQIDKIAHVMFGGLTHEPAVKLAENLYDVLNGHFNKFFFCDSGSVSVEVAVKMAFQYHMAQGNKRKSKILSFYGAYHGDTFMAMSLCDPINSMHKEFANILHNNIFATKPKSRFGNVYENDHLQVEEILKKHNDEIAAIIIEPVVQGAGGMWFYHPELLNKLRQLCDKYSILLIFDEVATGFGRTGKMFAFEHSNIVPDIICLGKAITGGYMSFAAVGTTQKIIDTVCSENGPGAFMHGPTFMANPLACECANAGLTLLKSYDIQKIASFLQNTINDYFSEAKKFDFVKDVRVLGGIGVIELQEYVNLRTITSKFVQRGVWVRPFKNLVYIMPPYVISEDSLKKLCKAVLESIWEEFSKK